MQPQQSHIWISCLLQAYSYLDKTILITSVIRLFSLLFHILQDPNKRPTSLPKNTVPTASSRGHHSLSPSIRKIMNISDTNLPNIDENQTLGQILLQTNLLGQKLSLTFLWLSHSLTQEGARRPNRYAVFRDSCAAARHC